MKKEKPKHNGGSRPNSGRHPVDKKFKRIVLSTSVSPMTIKALNEITDARNALASKESGFSGQFKMVSRSMIIEEALKNLYPDYFK